MLPLCQGNGHQVFEAIQVAVPSCWPPLPAFNSRDITLSHPPPLPPASSLPPSCFWIMPPLPFPSSFSLSCAGLSCPAFLIHRPSSKHPPFRSCTFILTIDACVPPSHLSCLWLSFPVLVNTTNPGKRPQAAPRFPPELPFPQATDPKAQGIPHMSSSTRTSGPLLISNPMPASQGWMRGPPAAPVKPASSSSSAFRLDNQGPSRAPPFSLRSRLRWPSALSRVEPRNGLQGKTAQPLPPLLPFLTRGCARRRFRR